jgi:hypothetical protein
MRTDNARARAVACRAPAERAEAHDNEVERHGARVMALEMPARDQPVAVDIGSRKTASENIAPTATQVIKAPTPTITQP